MTPATLRQKGVASDASPVMVALAMVMVAMVMVVMAVVMDGFRMAAAAAPLLPRPGPPSWRRRPLVKSTAGRTIATQYNPLDSIRGCQPSAAAVRTGAVDGLERELGCQPPSNIEPWRTRCVVLVEKMLRLQ